MDPKELLAQLNLSEPEFNILLLKFRVFYASLTESEAAVVNRLLPRFETAAALFSGTISRDDLKKLLMAPPALAPIPPAPTHPPAPGPPSPTPPPKRGTAGAFGQSGINQIPNGDGNGG
jgi:hypothetical protein